VNPVDGRAPSNEEKLNVDVVPKLIAGSVVLAGAAAALGAPVPGLGRGTMHMEHVGAVSGLSASQHAHFQPALAFGAGLPAGAGFDSDVYWKALVAVCLPLDRSVV
jgi:hypothetical protein